MTTSSPYFFLHGTASTLLIAAEHGQSPALLYWGPKLPESTDPLQIVRLRTRQGAAGGAFVEVPATLSCELGTGYLGPSGLQAHRDGKNWAPVLKVTEAVLEQDTHTLTINTQDHAHDIGVSYTFIIDAKTDVIRIQTSIKNTASANLTINWASVACIPLNRALNDIISFSGRWALEFQTARNPLPPTGFVTENRRGRTSHDRFPGLLLCTPGATEENGDCFGVHLGWSGNTRLRVDTLSDGRRILQAGEHFLPGEMVVAAGDSYTTPALFASYSTNGLSALSGNFHAYVREKLLDKRTCNKPRPVHYNTWEAIYFDHSPEKVLELVDAAAIVGAERFVLDDGWFLGRRNDQSGLGDWTVDRRIYPDGLTPIIDHVKNSGMTFGLWVEPEMVNEDSNLFRQHPDWVLATPPEPQTPFRHQLVLDMARAEVAENLFQQINALLCEYDIEYLKWDMNRDLNHPGNARGVASIHHQNRAVYALIERLRKKHPNVEIESCSSGGGRADYGILERTDRIWTSDSNDALDRQQIQRGASFFFPLSVMGAHVGPRNCHITNRHLSMELRAATAMFGHMGVEANILAMSDDDKTLLKQAFALHKEYRDLIHHGVFRRFDMPDDINCVGVMASDQSLGLISVAQVGSNGDVLPGVLKIPDLDPASSYHLQSIWPTQITTPPPHRLETSGLMDEGYLASGAILSNVGLQLPLLHPESCIVLKIERR